MTLGLVFWILMLLWLIFSCWFWWPTNPTPQPINTAWPNAFLFILLLILGWAVFGAPIR